MLSKIHIESYRTLRNTTVSFKDGLNIIIGLNGAGKSNLLGFISGIPMMKFATNYSIVQPQSLNTNYNYTLGYANVEDELTELDFQVEMKKPTSVDNDEDSNIVVRFTHKNNKKVVKDDTNVRSLDRKERAKLRNLIWQCHPFIRSYIKFELPNDKDYLSSPKSVTLDDAGGITEYFEHNFSFLDWFQYDLEEMAINHNFADEGLNKQHILNRFEDSINAINLNHHLSSFSGISQIRLSRNINIYTTELSLLIENLVLEFLIDGQWMPWSHLSDGTKRSFYLIAQVAFAKNELVLIEEPEIGLHPFQLHKIMTFIKEQSRTKQIILSTHSPEVLNILEPDELDHILIASINKGVTSFRNLNETQIQKAQSYINETGSLSDYWIHSDLEQYD